MAGNGNLECLSFGDALFLYLEREGMPLNVASMATFDGVIPLDACRTFVQSKLPSIPRYRQRVVAPPFNVGLPAWEYDPDFDIRTHIREVRLKRGTEAEFNSIAARILSCTMDRERPLWDFTLVQGLKGNRTGLIVRVHHCLADGLAGVELMSAIMDPSPTVPVLPKRPPRWKTPPPRGRSTALLDGMVTACFSAVQRVLTAQSEMLEFARQLVHVSEEPAANGDPRGLMQERPLPAPEQIARFLPELASPPERLPFNVVCRGPQRFQWAEISFRDIRAVKRACGTTVNDVILAIVTRALRRYCEARGVKTARRSLRIIVPVSIRSKDQSTELGNRITFLPVPLPMGGRSARTLLATVHERTSFLKSFRVAEVVGFAGTLLGLIPTPLQAMIGPIASALPLSVGNIICTNVPGPQQPLYLLGHEMLTCCPYVPIGGEFGLNCAVLTYNGKAYFGFSGDVHAVPDIHAMRKYTLASFAELCAEVGITERPRRRPKPSAVAESRPAPETAKVVAFPPAATGKKVEEEPKELAAAIGA